MQRKSGKIINMSSSAGKTAHPNASVCYGVSKAGINSLTQKLAYDLAPYGIRVNAVCPGPIETDMTNAVKEEIRKAWVEGIPLKRAGKPEDVANAALFLASDLSLYVTAQVIGVDGGMGA